MTDGQGNKIVRAAWILGISIVVAAIINGGGPYRVTMAGNYDAWLSIKTNTWTGKTWWCHRAIGWKELGPYQEKPEPGPVGMSPP